MSDQDAFATRLLAWFDVHGRHDLPWQQAITPYRVWLSEVMLQQTQVATVIPYYARFLKRFPDVHSLSRASLDEVLHLWTGLGYYARARNLHACAQQIVTQHAGEFPQDLEAMRALPGIGRSTAGAILSIASGRRHPILDGNVKRVLARVFGLDGDPASAAWQKALWEKADACTPHERVADYTQAIMDLGATLCTRSRPACTLCPLSEACVARREGRQGELPGRKKPRDKPLKQATLLIAKTRRQGAVAVYLERRALNGIWGGLYSPPEFDSEAAALEWLRERMRACETGRRSLPAIEHGFTHYDLRLNPVVVECTPHESVREGEALWYRLDQPPEVGLPQPIKALFERLMRETAPPA